MLFTVGKDCRTGGQPATAAAIKTQRTSQYLTLSGLCLVDAILTIPTPLSALPMSSTRALGKVSYRRPTTAMFSLDTFQEHPQILQDDWLDGRCEAGRRRRDALAARAVEPLSFVLMPTVQISSSRVKDRGLAEEDISSTCLRKVSAIGSDFVLEGHLCAHFCITSLVVRAWHALSGNFVC